MRTISGASEKQITPPVNAYKQDLGTFGFYSQANLSLAFEIMEFLVGCSCAGIPREAHHVQLYLEENPAVQSQVWTNRTDQSPWELG